MLKNRMLNDDDTAIDEEEDSLLDAKTEPKKNWTILIVIGFANLLLNAVGTMQAPFYPREAEMKGATATEFGFVFSVFQLATFFTCPFVGTLLGYLNPVFMYIIGVCSTAICTMLFGLLDWIDDRVTFVALSLTLRLMEGCGTAVFFSAAFTIVAAEFPKSVAVTFGMIQTCAGVGLIIGPSLGGLLYEFGGFPLPFILVGGVLLVSGILAYFVLPEPKMSNPGKTEGSQKRFGFLYLITIPSVAIDALSILMCASGIGFLEATLEPHVRHEFALTPFYTGLIFIIAGGTYALTSPIWGRLCDIGVQPRLITLTGYILTFSSFIFMGPPPGVFSTTLWGVCVGQAIHGIGAGATLISARTQASQNAIRNGYADNLSTYGLISAVWVAAYSFGNFIGPSVGGILLDYYGFRMATLYVLVTQAIMIILLVLPIHESNRHLSKGEIN